MTEIQLTGARSGIVLPLPGRRRGALGTLRSGRVPAIDDVPEVARPLHSVFVIVGCVGYIAWDFCEGLPLRNAESLAVENRDLVGRTYLLQEPQL